MKYLNEILFITCFIILMGLCIYSVDAYAAIPKACPTKPACNQHLYDAVYKVITRESLNDSEKNERKAAMKRYSYVMSLRQLCNGQLSTYETGKVKP